MAAAVPTLADIFATAFSSIGKVELAVEAAHVADHDVWIADARGLDDMLLKHRKPREQGAEDTSWDMLFATLVGKGIITSPVKTRIKEAVAAALDDAFRPKAPPPPDPDPKSCSARAAGGRAGEGP